MRTRGRWLASLSVEDDELVEPVLPAETISDATDAIGVGAVSWGVRQAYRLAEINIERFPALGGGPAQFDILRIGTESITLTSLIAVYEGKLEHWQITPEAKFHIRDLVHRAIPEVDVLGSIRFTHVTLCDWLMEACRGMAAADELADQLHLISHSLHFIFDTVADDVTETYEAEHKQYSQSPIARRDETLRRLLESDPDDIDNASGRLGYELDRRYHIAIVLTRTEPRYVDDALHLIARKMLQSFRVDQMLLVPEGRRTLWCWGNSRSSIPDRARLAENPGVSAIIGTPGRDLVGFRRSHQHAVEAQQVMEFLREASDTPLYFTDLHLLTLLGPDQQKLDDFVHRELRDLAGAGDTIAELRATLSTYLDNHSPQATASKMHIARNTVAYRLRRVEELLHHPISERQTEVRLALLLRGSAAFSE